MEEKLCTRNALGCRYTSVARRCCRKKNFCYLLSIVGAAVGSEAKADGGFLQAARGGRPMMWAPVGKGACQGGQVRLASPRLVSTPCAKPAPPCAPSFPAQVAPTRCHLSADSPLSTLPLLHGRNTLPSPFFRSSCHSLPLTLLSISLLALTTI
jgi:hypothetical protein